MPIARRSAAGRSPPSTPPSSAARRPAWSCGRCGRRSARRAPSRGAARERRSRTWPAMPASPTPDPTPERTAAETPAPPRCVDVEVEELDRRADQAGKQHLPWRVDGWKGRCSIGTRATGIVVSAIGPVRFRPGSSSRGARRHIIPSCYVGIAGRRSLTKRLSVIAVARDDGSGSEGGAGRPRRNPLLSFVVAVLLVLTGALHGLCGPDRGRTGSLAGGGRRSRRCGAL